MQGCRNANTRGAQFCICASVDASLPHHIKSRFNEPLSNSMPAGSGALDRAQGFIRTAIRGNVECERPASVLVLNLITNSINTLLDDFSAEQAAALLVLLRAKVGSKCLSNSKVGVQMPSRWQMPSNTAWR
eukprot:scaffold163593_cov18-Tisochrysis_lutea.AAC.1